MKRWFIYDRRGVRVTDSLKRLVGNETVGYSTLKGARQAIIRTLPFCNMRNGTRQLGYWKFICNDWIPYVKEHYVFKCKEVYFNGF